VQSGAVGAVGITDAFVPAARELSTKAYQRPSTEGVEEDVYVLTLKTSAELNEKMQALRGKWFPQHRNKVPAHITLFHALPRSRIIQVSESLETLSARTRCFDITTGHVLKRRNGVAVGLGQGEEDVKKVFGLVKDQFLECLSQQDRSFKAHWTVMNKEDDSRRVEDAFRDVEGTGVVKGVARGLVLWRYEKNGTWSFEREFGFLDGEVRAIDEVVDIEVDRFL
jgi:2'-5' RNA ligase